MNYSHLIHERSLTTTPHRQKPIIKPPDYPVVFLTQKNKSDRVQLVFFVVEMRDLPYSDCYRRSIACSRRGSHGNAVLRFFKIAINPRFDDIKKQVEQGSTCLLCGGDAGFALQRLLPKVNRVQPKGFTRQCRVAIFQNRNKSPLRRYKKTSRTGFNLSSLWWRCGDLNPGPPDRPRHFLHV